jgi:hypothetical protein
VAVVQHAKLSSASLGATDARIALLIEHGIARMPATLDESPERHDWTLSGHRITQLCVDPTSCRIQSWSFTDSLEIRLGAPFRLTLADATSRDIDPKSPEQLAPLLSTIGLEISHFTVTQSGALRIQISDGSAIGIASHPRYEAFHVSGGGSLEGITYLARPGGGSW